MIIRIEQEREAVKGLVKAEIEKMMQEGCDITQMRYHDESPHLKLPCRKPKHMRTSFCQDGSLSNIKKVHWIFHQWPFGTHQDVLMKRQTHGEWVVAKVMQRMNLIWGPKKEGETKAHTNCIVHVYSRILNEKRSNVITKGTANSHNHVPYVRNPKKIKGATMFYWNHPIKGSSLVRKRYSYCMSASAATSNSN